MSDVIHPGRPSRLPLDGKAKDNLFYLAVADAVGPERPSTAWIPSTSRQARYGAPGQGR